MKEEKKIGGEKAAISVLIASTLVQIVTLAFLWNPERFRQNWENLINALKRGKEKVKGAVAKDKKDD